MMEIKTKENIPVFILENDMFQKLLEEVGIEQLPVKGIKGMAMSIREYEKNYVAKLLGVKPEEIQSRIIVKPKNAYMWFRSDVHETTHMNDQEPTVDTQNPYAYDQLIWK